MTAAGTGATGERALLVVIPTYNEVENLTGILSRIRRAVPSADVLIVDDASPDGTGDLAEQHARDDSAIHVRHRPGKAGLGTAYICGFAWGLDRGYGLFVEMDADGSHAPDDLPHLLTTMDEADLAIGSRYVPGGAVVNWPRRRLLLSRAGNAFVRVAIRLPIRDATAGFRVYSRRALEVANYGTVETQGYGFQVDMTRRVARAGLVIVEVPITFTERTRGVSKMDSAIVREALVSVSRWAAEDRLLVIREVLRRRLAVGSTGLARPRPLADVQGVGAARDGAASQPPPD